MGARRLLNFGIFMPSIYLLTLLVSMKLHPGFSPGETAPSEMGREGVAYGWVYCAGMVLTGGFGLLGGIGLWRGLRPTGAIWAGLPAATLVLSSIGLAMSGLFPLPSPLHYGFGLSAFGALVPLFGALVLWRMEERKHALVQMLAFAAIVALAVLNEAPLYLGMVMMFAVAGLCRTMHGHQPKNQVSA